MIVFLPLRSVATAGPFRWFPVALASCTLFTAVTCGQSEDAREFTAEHRQQGYCQIGDVTYFVFDPEVYGRGQPTRVVVTGAFRNWDQNMEERRWQLQPDARSARTVGPRRP